MRHTGGIARVRGSGGVLDGQAAIAHAGVGHGAATHHLRVEAVASGDVGAGKTVLREDAAGHIAAKAARAEDRLIPVSSCSQPFSSCILSPL